jgi:hypothetical protein
MAKTRTASKETQRLRVELRRIRRDQAQQRRKEQEAREAAIRAALARPTSEAARVLVDPKRPTRPRSYPPRTQAILDIVRDRAPRLVTDDAMRAFNVMSQLDWLRPLADWQPAGKGADTLLRSLAQHLFGRFRMPPVLWTSFWTPNNSVTLARVAAHVAAGGSFFEAVRSGLMPVPLTEECVMTS